MDDVFYEIEVKKETAFSESEIKIFIEKTLYDQSFILFNLLQIYGTKTRIAQLTCSDSVNGVNCYVKVPLNNRVI
jgi:hypothetical protein